MHKPIKEVEHQRFKKKIFLKRCIPKALKRIATPLSLVSSHFWFWFLALWWIPYWFVPASAHPSTSCYISALPSYASLINSA